MNSGLQAQAEEAVLPHMMHLALEKLYEEGYEARLDARGYLNNAIKKIVMRVPGREQVVAQHADRMATELMRDTDFDDSRVALLATAYFILKLVDERMHPDPECQSCLTALLVTSDADADENPETHKLVPLAKEKAGKMFSKALNRGMYNLTRVQ